MNANEKLFEAVNGIAPDLVEAAGKFRFRRRAPRAIAVAAAACLMLGIGAAMAAMLPKLAGNHPEQQAVLPTETAETVPTDNGACGSEANTGAEDRLCVKRRVRDRNGAKTRRAVRFRGAFEGDG